MLSRARWPLPSSGEDRRGRQWAWSTSPGTRPTGSRHQGHRARGGGDPAAGCGWPARSRPSPGPAIPCRPRARPEISTGRRLMSYQYCSRQTWRRRCAEHGPAARGAFTAGPAGLAGRWRPSTRPGGAPRPQAGHVMLDDGQPVVIDSASAAHPGLQPGSPDRPGDGTPGYLSPRDHRGQEPAGHRLPSWGTTMAYAATGPSPTAPADFQTVFYGCSRAAGAGRRPAGACCRWSPPPLHTTRLRPTARSLVSCARRSVATGAIAPSPAPVPAYRPRTARVPVAAQAAPDVIDLLPPVDYAARAASRPWASRRSHRQSPAAAPAAARPQARPRRRAA